MKGWRTITFNVLVAVAALLDGLGLLPWGQILPAEHVPFVIFGLAAGNVLLRVITTGPWGEST